MQNDEEVANAQKELKGELFVYNYQYRRLTSDFEGKLAELMFKADSFNLKKLAKAFPEEAKAVQNYYKVEGWWDECQDKVEAYFESYTEYLKKRWL